MFSCKIVIVNSNQLIRYFSILENVLTFLIGGKRYLFMVSKRVFLYTELCSEGSLCMACQAWDASLIGSCCVWLTAASPGFFRVREIAELYLRCPVA